MKNLSLFLIGASVVGQVVSVIIMICLVNAESTIMAITDNVIFIGVIITLASLQYLGWKLLERSEKVEKEDACRAKNNQ